MKRKKYTESIVKSQNIVEQANSNPNNISPTMSRRHIICKSSSVAEMNHKFHSQYNTNMCRIINAKFDEFVESQNLAVFPT